MRKIIPFKTLCMILTFFMVGTVLAAIPAPCGCPCACCHRPPVPEHGLDCAPPWDLPFLSVNLTPSTAHRPADPACRHDLESSSCAMDRPQTVAFLLSAENHTFKPGRQPFDAVVLLDFNGNDPATQAMALIPAGRGFEAGASPVPLYLQKSAFLC